MSAKTRKSVKIRTLKDMVESNPKCKKRFEEAQRLAEKIFKENIPLPFYTIHGEGHCLKVEKYINEIIWRSENWVESHDLIPTPEEAMYLRSAIWLHDIGMWYGILDGDNDAEKLTDPNYVIELRDEHELRTSTYLQDKWGDDCTWSDDEKQYLANICIYHRRAHPISNFQPHKIDGKHPKGKVQLAVLAALLRLGDACHVDESRAPGDMMALYISLGMQQEARCHWERANLIREVKFEHVSGNVIVTGHYPPKVKFDFGAFDLGEVGEIVRHNIDEELLSVRAILLHYGNTSFWNVKHVRNYMPAHAHRQKEKCLALWPYLMDKPVSSTGAVAALIEVLWLAAKNGRSEWLTKPTKARVSEIMERTKASRPVDFMIRNLCKEVEKRIPKAIKASRNEFIEYLNSTKKMIKENCSKMMRNGLATIDDQDALVIYGYSTSVSTLLHNVDTAHCLYMVDSPELSGTGGKTNECRRMIDLAKGRDFSEVKYLPVGVLPQAFGELRREKKPCKLLLCTHGVLKSRDFICKVGSYALAVIAKQFNVEVIVFAEDMKILRNGIRDDEIAGDERIFCSKKCREHNEMRGVLNLKAVGDKVPKRFVDKVVTERGVFRIKEYKIAKQKATRRISVKTKIHK